MYVVRFPLVISIFRMIWVSAFGVGVIVSYTNGFVVVTELIVGDSALWKLISIVVRSLLIVARLCAVVPGESLITGCGYG